MMEFRYKNGAFTADKTYIMGIVNITPDSFSDGGLYFSTENAVCHALEMRSQGADIIDLGAMSTRPGSVPITYREEIKRLEPVLSAVASQTDAVISVDTVYPETADFALNKGAHIINDVSGFFNEKTAQIVKKHGAGWIITHTGNLPSETKVKYSDGVVAEVKKFFDDMILKCEKFGLNKKNICLDPGFGFAKTTNDNIELLKNLEKVIPDDVTFLTGLSKKRFIGDITNNENADDRLIGTVTADIFAVLKGSNIIRVHDVKEAADSLKILEALR